jgi:hypothetical protein
MVQGFGAASEAAEGATEAEAADDAGPIARRLPAGPGGARREAIAREADFIAIRNPLKSGIAAP